MDEVLLIRRTPSTAVAIPVATLQDTRLSFRARGVLAFLLTFEDDTLISTADLPQHGTEGRDALRKALGELKEFDYVRQTRYSYVDDLGRTLWAWETTIGDVPFPGPENPSSEIDLVTENPSSEMGLVTQTTTHRENTHDTPGLTTLSEDGFSGFLTTSYKTTSSLDLNKDTSYLSAGQARPRVQGGWGSTPSGKPKRQTKRERDEEARDAEVATDPFAANLDGGPEPEPSDTGSGDPLAEGRQEIAAKRSTRAISPAKNLARYFEISAPPQAGEEAAGRFSRDLLAKNIAAWRREGTPDSQIRTMIATYWGPGFRRNLTTPAWKDFINQRGQILGQSQKASTVVAWEANRLNENFWD